MEIILRCKCGHVREHHENEAGSCTFYRVALFRGQPDGPVCKCEKYDPAENEGKGK